MAAERAVPGEQLDPESPERGSLVGTDQTGGPGAAIHDLGGDTGLATERGASAPGPLQPSRSAGSSAAPEQSEDDRPEYVELDPTPVRRGADGETTARRAQKDADGP